MAKIIPLKIYKITYLGAYLGGLAIVLAKTKKGALRLVKEHSETGSFIEVSVEEITRDFTKPLILTNRNGEW